MAVTVHFKDDVVKVFDEATHYDVDKWGDTYNIYEIDEFVASVNMVEVRYIEKDNFKGEKV